MIRIDLVKRFSAASSFPLGLATKQTEEAEEEMYPLIYNSLLVVLSPTWAGVYGPLFMAFQNAGSEDPK